MLGVVGVRRLRTRYVVNYISCYTWRHLASTVSSSDTVEGLTPVEKLKPEDGSSWEKNSPAVRQLLDRLLRVDHAGEYGAVRIYQGQLDVLGRSNVEPVIREFMEQEKGHLHIMEDLMRRNRVRPTAILPAWHIGAYLLGAGSALLGKEGAMACTVAVETVIGEHYDNQIRTLMNDGENGTEKHRPLIEKISRIRDEELEHLDSGLKHDAELAPLYKALTQVIKIGCWGAIWVSERI